MSPTNKDRMIRYESGIESPVGSGSPAHEGLGFAAAIAVALKSEFGGSHGAVKRVVALTNANERAVKNWFSAKNGPSGQSLVDLMRSSDAVLEMLLAMAGRDEILKAKKLADARAILRKIVLLLDELQ